MSPTHSNSQSRSSEHSEPVSGAPSVDHWCDLALENAWLAAVVLTPLLFNGYSFTGFEPEKQLLLIALAAFTCLVWLVKFLCGHRLAGLPRVWVLPALALLVGVLSAWFSIDPQRSVLGSYQRAQGLLGQVAIGCVALSVALHCRHTEQHKRLAIALILGSVPVALIAWLQRFGVELSGFPGDPARTAIRASATLGNPIFLGAYLSIACIVTLLAGVRLCFAGADSERTHWANSRACLLTLLGAVLVLQIGALVFTGSRGPVLGLFAALAVLVLLWLALSPGAQQRRGIVLWWFALCSVVLVSGALVAKSAAESVDAEKQPNRLFTLFDPRFRTTQERLALWGAAETVYLSGTVGVADVDPNKPLRWLVGGGQETQWPRLLAAYPPAFANYQKVDESVDRVHNRYWDTALTTGLLGIGAQLALLLWFGCFALRALGLRADRAGGGVRMWAAVGTCVIVPGVCLGLIGEFRFFGVALPLLLIGLFCVCASRAGWVKAAQSTTGALRCSPMEHDRRLVVIGGLAIAVAHQIESAVGLVTLCSSLLFYVGVAVAVASATSRHPDISPGAEANTRWHSLLAQPLGVLLPGIGWLVYQGVRPLGETASGGGSFSAFVVLIALVVLWCAGMALWANWRSANLAGLSQSSEDSRHRGSGHWPYGGAAEWCRARAALFSELGRFAGRALGGVG